MAETRCPMCGKVNPPDLDVCQYCGARLKPVVPSSPDEAQPIHPGEAPTPKNTAELERALPSWLRSLREGKDSPESESIEASSDQGLPLGSNSGTASEPSEGLPDWLAGLGKASSEEEEQVPDWLAGLRTDKTEAPSEKMEPGGEQAPDLGNSDWMSRLDASSPAGAPGQIHNEKMAFEAPAASESEDQTPDWLKSIQPEESKPTEASAPSTEGENYPDWFSGLSGVSTGGEPESELPSSEFEEPAVPGNLPDWLSQLKEKSAELEPAPPANENEPTFSSEGIPDWLGQLQEKGAVSEPPSFPTEEPIPQQDSPDWLNVLQEKSAEAESVPPVSPIEENPPKENIPDWLNQLQGKGVEADVSSPVEKSETVPDWLSGLEAGEKGPVTTPGENVPDWLEGLQSKSVSPAEESPVPESQGETALPPEAPSWLSQLQADIVAAEEAGKQKDEFEVVSESSDNEKGMEPIPEWLSGLEGKTPPTSGTPALIIDNKGNAPESASEAAFSMEAPDWLSKLTPEQSPDSSASTEEQTPTAEIEAAALPTWVQAMRPVESVVDETKAGSVEEEQITEQSGPLAGLIGVIPSGPGLGSFRKPPAYSVKLQVSDAQQRYISNFEGLIANETKTRLVKSTRLVSNRLWRWAIALLLVLTVTFPFLTPQTRLTPPTTLMASDKNATSNLIGALPANAPVLMAFDYEPSLSGELEAVAAPLVDQLETKGARLAIMSTSATGPALAEHFFQNASLVNSHQYKSGEQYVNLGYLAGGSAGIAYFAASPSVAMPVTMDGGTAWTTTPLQGVAQLSDFAVVIILTDNADTGRNWIEQSSLYLGQTPMVMVISTQAEPMIRPYFDSGQLKGLVSGLVDAKTYEQSYNRPGLADHYWDSFSLASLVAEIMIAIGAIWSAFAAWRARRKGIHEEV
jgi:hypothetical protein